MDWISVCGSDSVHLIITNVSRDKDVIGFILFYDAHAHQGNMLLKREKGEDILHEDIKFLLKEVI